MPFNPLTHFVLVDFENRPDIDLAALAGHPVTVTLFLGEKSKLKAALVEQITKLSFEVRLIKVGVTGKNALDFLLAFHLGEMVARSPRGHYHIISGDKDFEPLVAHLQANHFHVTQHSEIATLPFVAAKVAGPVLKLPPPAKAGASGKSKTPFKPAPTPRIAPSEVVSPAPKPGVDKQAELMSRFKNPATKNRPSTRIRLLADIKNRLGKQATDAKVTSLLGDLIDGRILTIDAKGKVIYP